MEELLAQGTKVREIYIKPLYEGGSAALYTGGHGTTIGSIGGGFSASAGFFFGSPHDFSRARSHSLTRFKVGFTLQSDGFVLRGVQFGGGFGDERGISNSLNGSEMN